NPSLLPISEIVSPCPSTARSSKISSTRSADLTSEGLIRAGSDIAFDMLDRWIDDRGKVLVLAQHDRHSTGRKVRDVRDRLAHLRRLQGGLERSLVVEVHVRNQVVRRGVAINCCHHMAKADISHAGNALNHWCVYDAVVPIELRRV